MEPAKPPFPSPRYLPFQPEAGIQTSNSMCESAEGCRTACTRQKAGRLLKLTAAWPISGAGGGVNDPAATTCAAVIVVPESLRAVKLSHVAAPTGATRIMTQSRIFNAPPMMVYARQPGFFHDMPRG